MKPYYEHAGITIYHGLLLVGCYMARLAKVFEVGQHVVSHVAIFMMAVGRTRSASLAWTESGNQPAGAFTLSLDRCFLAYPSGMLRPERLTLCDMLRSLMESDFRTRLEFGHIFPALTCSVSACSFVGIHNHSLSRMVAA